MDDAFSIYDGWLLALTCAAAVIDARSGLIPNWLTLPTLALAPLAHALQAGPGALGGALLSALLCAAVPLLLFARRAMGGGDVKLFAAAGALVGLHAGLTLQLLSYALATLLAMGWLVQSGELLPMLGRALRLLAGMFSARARRAAPAAAALTSVRLGVSVFIADAVLLIARGLGA